MDKEKSLDLTAHIVSAYFENNSVLPTELAQIIQDVSRALEKLSQPQTETMARPEPAVPVKKSVTPEFLISLEDGRQFKSLKRHLSVLGMTPAEYRAKWGLPNDYPMTAASYSAKRSELARTLGLGRKRQEQQEAAPAQEPVPAQPKKRGRPKKTALA